MEWKTMCGWTLKWMRFLYISDFFLKKNKTIFLERYAMNFLNHKNVRNGHEYKENIKICSKKKSKWCEMKKKHEMHVDFVNVGSLGFFAWK